MGELFNNKNQKCLRQALRRNMPFPEVLLWSKLKNRQLGFKFRRQHGIGNYIVDFYCPGKKLAIEIDGDSHFAKRALEADEERDSFHRFREIRVLRFTNQEVTNNINGVIEKIIDPKKQSQPRSELKAGREKRKLS